MSELDSLNLRISITKVLLVKKSEYYHHITMHGNPERRQKALLDCAVLRAELLDLKKQRNNLLSRN